METDDVRFTAIVQENTKRWLKREAILMNWDVGTVIEKLVQMAQKYPDEWGRRTHGLVRRPSTWQIIA